MAIYRFRITFEDYDEIYREIDMLSKHTFIDLHEAIHRTTGYDPNLSSSFYVSNDHWKKGKEVAFKPNARKKEEGVLEMDGLRLAKLIDDPHQKFYYVYNFDRPYDFHVELIKILKEEEGKEYPSVFKSVGEAPKPAKIATVALDLEDEDVDMDHEPDIEEDEYGVEEEELDFLSGREEKDSSESLDDY